jgi:NAD-dependent deacetylase
MVLNFQTAPILFNTKQHIVVLTGAGISAESGIKTFRDSDGTWENYRIEDVATPQAWEKDRALVLEFYNQRRKQVLEAQPNPAHRALVELESKYKVSIVTQNVDDLHERAGSTSILHLHGEIRKARSTIKPVEIVNIEGWELNLGDKCSKGSQLRPHIVWFGEAVPALEDAADLISTADILLVIGTSLVVYPAAGLIYEAPYDCRKYLIDPNAPEVSADFTIINKPAGTGVPELVSQLLR